MVAAEQSLLLGVYRIDPPTPISETGGLVEECSWRHRAPLLLLLLLLQLCVCV